MTELACTSSGVIGGAWSQYIYRDRGRVTKYRVRRASESRTVDLALVAAFERNGSQYIRGGDLHVAVAHARGGSLNLA